MKYVALFSVALFLLLPVTTHGETVLRTGTDISVDADQTVEGDYYVSVGAFGKTVMSGSIQDDMYAFGAAVTVNGEVGADVAILAGTSQIHAPVVDDVRIFAGEVIIAENVGGDVFVLAGSLSVLSTATISGDIFFFGGDLLIEGNVEGSVLGKAQSVIVDSHISGDFDMTAPVGVTLGDNAIIDGSVSYTSLTALSRGQGAVISGEVLRAESSAVTARQQARGVLIPIFITLFATLSLYLLFKKELEAIVVSIETAFTRNLLIGSALAFLGPITAVLLMITVLGLFVGIMTLAVVVLLYVVGVALSSVVFGAFLMKLITKKLEVTLVTIIVGTVALQGLIFLPIIGPLAIYLIFAVTVGALTQRLYRTIV